MNLTFRIPAAWILSMVSSVVGFADQPASHSNVTGSGPTPPKPYLLFLGSDLSVERYGKLCPVKGVTNQGYVIDVDGRRETISATSDELMFQGKQSLKVAPTGIVISQLEIKRTYTPENDPQRAREIAAANAAGMAAKMDNDRYQSNVALARATNYVSSQATSESFSTERAYQLQSTYQQASATALSDLGSATTNLSSLGLGGTSGSEGNFDALRVSFDIASPVPANGVYMVMVLRIRDAAHGTAPESVMILGHNIDDVGAKAKTVEVFRGGFPPGYSIVGAQVHFYDARAELASNIAPRHVELTADEAFQFSVAEYVSQHRNADTPAVRATTALPAAARTSLSADQHGRTYFVKVDKSGLPKGAFLDEACTQPVAADNLASALATLRFYPALKAGKPVESVAPVQL